MGAATKRTRAIADKAAADGDLLPLEVMLHSMRAALLDGDLPLAVSIARDAAPYCHPRLSAITVEENIDVSTMSDKQLEDEIQLLQGSDEQIEDRIRHLREAEKPPGAVH